MKKILLLTSLLFITLIVQSQKRMFLRIVDESGQIRHRGYLQSMTDSSIVIKENKLQLEIPVNQISSIKMKRSAGHAAAFSAIAAGVTLAILGAASADPDAWIFAYTAGEGAVMGLLSGSVVGFAIGGISSGLIKRPVLEINMNQEKWLKAKDALKKYLFIQPN